MVAIINDTQKNAFGVRFVSILATRLDPGGHKYPHIRQYMTLPEVKGVEDCMKSKENIERDAIEQANQIRTHMTSI